MVLWLQKTQSRMQARTPESGRQHCVSLPRCVVSLELHKNGKVDDRSDHKAHVRILRGENTKHIRIQHAVDLPVDVVMEAQPCQGKAPNRQSTIGSRCFEHTSNSLVGTT